MIGLALRHCSDTLSEREEGDRMIILVSDGQSFDLSGGQDEVIAEELMNLRRTRSPGSNRPVQF